MNWLSLHFAALRDTLRRLMRAPLAAILTALAIGVAITLPAGLYLGVKNIESLAGGLPAKPEISIFVAKTATTAQRKFLEQSLSRHPGLTQLHLVSSEDALAHLNRQGLSNITAGLNHNPLPDAWVATPKNIEPGEMEALRIELAKLPGVESVLADSTWAARLQAILRIGHYLTALLAVLFALALVAIASNVIRAQILGRQDEIEVSRLIGATDRFIRRPFLYYGAIQGFTGGLTALGLVWVLILLLSAPVNQLASLYGSPFVLTFPTPNETLLVLGGTTLFSWLGAWLAVSRSLHQID